MVLDNAIVYLSNDTVTQGRVLFKDSGYIGVNDGTGWVYFPPHKIDKVESKAGQ